MRCRVIYWNEDVMDRDQRQRALAGEFLRNPALYSVVGSCEIPEIRTDPDSRALVAEQIFQKFNIGDRGGRDDIRSMSLGDLVVFEDGSALVCRVVGWTYEDLPEGFSEVIKVLDDTRFLKRLQVKMAGGAWKCQG